MSPVARLPYVETGPRGPCRDPQTESQPLAILGRGRARQIVPKEWTRMATFARWSICRSMAAVRRPQHIESNKGQKDSNSASNQRSTVGNGFIIESRTPSRRSHGARGCGQYRDRQANEAAHESYFCGSGFLTHRTPPNVPPARGRVTSSRKNRRLDDSWARACDFRLSAAWAYATSVADYEVKWHVRPEHLGHRRLHHGGPQKAGATSACA